MLKKMFANLMANLGYISIQDYNAAMYNGVRLEQDNRKLSSENENLKREMELLNDENQSLWDMLDEINAANNFGKDQVKSMMKDIEEAMTDEMMKNFKPIAEG